MISLKTALCIFVLGFQIGMSTEIIIPANLQGQTDPCPEGSGMIAVLLPDKGSKDPLRFYCPGSSVVSTSSLKTLLKITIDTSAWTVELQREVLKFALLSNLSEDFCLRSSDFPLRPWRRSDPVKSIPLSYSTNVPFVGIISFKLNEQEGQILLFSVDSIDGKELIKETVELNTDLWLASKDSASECGGLKVTRRDQMQRLLEEKVEYGASDFDFYKVLKQLKWLRTMFSVHSSKENTQLSWSHNLLFKASAGFMTTSWTLETEPSGSDLASFCSGVPPLPGNSQPLTWKYVRESSRRAQRLLLCSKMLSNGSGVTGVDAAISETVSFIQEIEGRYYRRPSVLNQSLISVVFSFADAVADTLKKILPDPSKSGTLAGHESFSSLVQWSIDMRGQIEAKREMVPSLMEVVLGRSASTLETALPLLSSGNGLENLFIAFEAANAIAGIYMAFTDDKSASDSKLPHIGDLRDWDPLLTAGIDQISYGNTICKGNPLFAVEIVQVGEFKFICDPDEMQSKGFSLIGGDPSQSGQVRIRLLESFEGLVRGCDREQGTVCYVASSEQKEGVLLQSGTSCSLSGSTLSPYLGFIDVNSSASQPKRRFILFELNTNFKGPNMLKVVWAAKDIWKTTTPVKCGEETWPGSSTTFTRSQIEFTSLFWSHAFPTTSLLVLEMKETTLERVIFEDQTPESLHWENKDPEFHTVRFPLQDGMKVFKDAVMTYPCDSSSCTFGGGKGSSLIGAVVSADSTWFIIDTLKSPLVLRVAVKMALSGQLVASKDTEFAETQIVLDEQVLDHKADSFRVIGIRDGIVMQFDEGDDEPGVFGIRNSRESSPGEHHESPVQRLVRIEHVAGPSGM